jgi:N-acetylglutamate synthase-like GNAT family acetyltransferase
LANIESRALELNEIGWWSNWGDTKWFGRDAYLLTSREFSEPFFNRAGFLTCESARKNLPKAEEVLRAKGLVPHLTIFESCDDSSDPLKPGGYSRFDEMIVQEAGKESIPTNEDVLVREIATRDLTTWVETYLVSFYGETSLEPQVLRVVRRLMGAKRVTLLVAEMEGMAAGVTALYRTPGLLGLYCLGTLPALRGRGIARSILSRAQAISIREKRALILQSLASEETEPFYAKFGFRRLYAKRFMKRLSTGTERADTAKVFGTAITRAPGIGLHPFSDVFNGFEKIGAVKGIFGDRVKGVFSKLRVEIADEDGYMHINPRKGSVVASASYLRDGEETHLYLDIIHELVHIRQHMEGKELWDRRYKYVDRPTEIEAYEVAVEEARRIGLDDDQIAQYLKVEWVSADDFKRFLKTLGVMARSSKTD